MSTNATMATAVLPSILQRQVVELVGARPIHARPITAGMTLARRWVVEFDSGLRAFLKAATNPATAAWLRTEYQVYQSLSGPHLPKLIGWSNQSPGPFMLLEDLSHAHWPPPWSPGQIQQVLDVIRGVHRTRIKLDLPRLGPKAADWRGWHRVAANPAPFLALNLCDSKWLDQAVPKLIAAENQATLDGEDLLHGDLSSGNICFDDSRVVLLDWNWATIGNGLFDIAAWLPSLADETGCLPESILPSETALAALISGSLAHNATLPAPAQVPRLREFQLRKLKHALAWAARELALSAPP